MSRGARHGRSKPVRERRCVATGEVKEEEDLLRVALSPEGRVTPDVAARLPGRGGWVSADRTLVDKAVKKRLFNRAFEQPVEAPDNLADQFESLAVGSHAAPSSPRSDAASSGSGSPPRR